MQHGCESVGLGIEPGFLSGVWGVGIGGLGLFDWRSRFEISV